MPKGGRRSANADGSQKPRPVRDTASEITVRAYDRRMRDRFDETQKAISILSNLCDSNRTEDENAINAVNISAGRNVFRAVWQNVRDIARKLETLVTRYDLITIAYLIDDTNNRQYFTLMSCENIDSILWDLCDQLHQQIDQIIVLIRMIESAQKSKSPKKGARNKKSQSSDSAFRQMSKNVTPGPVAELSRSAPPGIVEETENTSFASVLRVLQIADSCIERAISWSHPIFNQGADTLKCEDCGTRVRILQDVSEAICDHCGRITVIIGSTQTDEGGTISSQDASRGRRGGYTYMRHLRIWLDRLQAIENYEFDVEDLAKIKKSIESEYVLPELINWRGVQCRDIIRHLELCGLSHLGEHVPKLVKELGGHAPPVLDYESEQVIVRDFMHIMDIYSHLYHDPGNKPYYPFFISKVIKRRFTSSSDIYRMLLYISHQGHDTVNKNDRIYKQICKIAPPQYDLTYEPEIE